MRSKGLFIAGTDTGVGKTTVAAALVRLAKKMGCEAVGIKPIETGCPVKDGILFPEDGHYLWEASNRAVTLDECSPFRFVFPAAPYRAAAVVGSQLFPKEILNHVQEITRRADLAIVEGAGGLMVPIDENYFVIDMISDLGFPVLLVCRSKLGTLNHTLLSIEALHNRRLTVAGIIISFTEPQSGPEEEFVVSDMRRLVRDAPIYGLKHLTEELRNDLDFIAKHFETIIPRDVFLTWFGLSE